MSIDMDECKKHTHNTNQLYSFPAPKKLGVLFSLHQCVRAQCGFRFPGASSLIRSLRSVMRLWRARPPQSCGKPHHCWAERRKPRESPLLKKTPKRRCYLIRLFSAFPVSPRHTPKGVARDATPLPRIDLLRRFVSCCFFSMFFVYLSHPG